MKFSDSIDLEINRTLWDVFRITNGMQDGDPAERVHRAFTRMEQELSE